MSARDDYPRRRLGEPIPDDAELISFAVYTRMCAELDRLRAQVVSQSAAADHDPSGADHLADAVRLAQENDRMRQQLADTQPVIEAAAEETEAEDDFDAAAGDGYEMLDDLHARWMNAIARRKSAVRAWRAAGREVQP